MLLQGCSSSPSKVCARICSALLFTELIKRQKRRRRGRRRAAHFVHVPGKALSQQCETRKTDALRPPGLSLWHTIMPCAALYVESAALSLALILVPCLIPGWEQEDAARRRALVSRRLSNLPCCMNANNERSSLAESRLRSGPRDQVCAAPCLPLPPLFSQR